MTRSFASETDPRALSEKLIEHSLAQAKLLSQLSFHHGTLLGRDLLRHTLSSALSAQKVLTNTDPLSLAAEGRDYLLDAQQRGALYLDAMRQRADTAIQREADGMTPVLAFDYEIIVDGQTLDRPVNYSLVHILPGADFPATRQDGRPWVIIDPRAGHGSGIGGFKAESEVGVALQDGHPVYFVIFHPDPEPGQTLADVTKAEARFLEVIIERHPNAPKPLVTGNCQGGWASMILAATHPHLTGPLVVAGAPLSYWAGQVGRNPFRYYGGLAGGAVPALLASDLGGGVFDGASLVQNFEGLNPAKTMWRKNYDLYADVDQGVDRFLQFEKWWSGYYCMNAAEIRWIVENLFIGNKLTAGEAIMDDGTRIDLTRIEAPVVVFASHGDNITPPQQALHWIADLYDTTEELRARGHVIIYTLHDSIGHLGIFVSAKVANLQHKQITSVVKTIESLPPGLYEMIVGTDADGAYQVEFQDRQVDDIRAMNDQPEVAEEFRSVADLSEWMVTSYDLFARPIVQAGTSPLVAQASRDLHPMRLQMKGFASDNPAMFAIKDLAEHARNHRQTTRPDNSFVAAQHALADMLERNLDLFRDTRDALIELSFHSLYANPILRALSPPKPVAPEKHDLAAFPEVREMLSHVNKGGFPEAIVRMLILLARARGTVRRDRLERANALLHDRAPFNSMDEATRNHIIHEQSLIVDLASKQALAGLPDLLRDDVDRLRAVDLVLDVAGPAEEMDAPTIAMVEKIQNVLRARGKNWHPEKVARQG